VLAVRQNDSGDRIWQPGVSETQDSSIFLASGMIRETRLRTVPQSKQNYMSENNMSTYSTSSSQRSEIAFVDLFIRSLYSSLSVYVILLHISYNFSLVKLSF